MSDNLVEWCWHPEPILLARPGGDGRGGGWGRQLVCSWLSQGGDPAAKADEVRAAAAAEGLELVPSSSNESGFKGVMKLQGKYKVSIRAEGQAAPPRHLCDAGGGGPVLREAHRGGASGGRGGGGKGRRAAAPHAGRGQGGRAPRWPNASCWCRRRATNRASRA